MGSITTSSARIPRDSSTSGRYRENQGSRLRVVSLRGNLGLHRLIRRYPYRCNQPDTDHWYDCVVSVFLRGLSCTGDSHRKDRSLTSLVLAWCLPVFNVHRVSYCVGGLSSSLFHLLPFWHGISWRCCRSTTTSPRPTQCPSGFCCLLLTSRLFSRGTELFGRLSKTAASPSTV